MRVLLLNQRQIRWSLLFLLITVFTAGIAANWTSLSRQFIGVKPGVRLEDYNVQGYLPEEVAVLVKALAAKFNREARTCLQFEAYVF